jgi:non-ribosomal peptide synthase protein (TIGR01720 family)
MTDAHAAVSEQAATVPHRGAGYGILRYLDDRGDVSRALTEAPQPAIGFNYRGRLVPVGSEVLPGRVSQLSGPRIDPNSPRWIQIYVEALVENDQLVTRWNFARPLHDQQARQSLVYAYAIALAASFGEAPADVHVVVES